MQGRSRNRGCAAHGVERRANLAQHLETGGRLPRGRRSAERAVDPPGREAPALGVKRDEVERRPALRAVREKAAQELVAVAARAEIAGGGGPAHRGVGQRRLHRRRRDVVQRVELLGGPAPVGDVGLVPQLPQPPAHGLRPVALHAVRDQRAHEAAPLVVVLGRHRPQAGLVGAPLRRTRLEGEPLLGILRHQCARGERQLHQRAVPGLHHRVIHLVGDAEVVERPPGGVLVVDVAAPPVRQRPADATVEDVVRAHVVRLLGELADGPEVALAGRGRGPVDLVVAEAGPQAAERAERRAAVDTHRGRRGTGRRREAR